MGAQLEPGFDQQRPDDDQDDGQPEAACAKQTQKNQSQAGETEHMAAGEGKTVFFRQVVVRPAPFDCVLDDDTGTIGETQGRQTPQGEQPVARQGDDTCDDETPDDVDFGSQGVR